MAGDDPREAFVFYNYTTSVAVAILPIVEFFIVTIAHVTKMAMKKTWYLIPFVLGCLFKAVSYIGRTLSSRGTRLHQEPIHRAVTPDLPWAGIDGGNRVHGSRPVGVVLQGEKHALINPRWVTKVFVTGDVLSFFTQGAGAGLLSTAKTQTDVNKANYKITPWQALLFALYIASTVILVRSVYRVAEYAQGSDGELQRKEFWLYIFDSLPIIVVTINFLAFHPGRVVNRKSLSFKSSSSPENGIDMTRDVSSELSP